jgi:hypothetical protein
MANWWHRDGCKKEVATRDASVETGGPPARVALRPMKHVSRYEYLLVCQASTINISYMSVLVPTSSIVGKNIFAFFIKLVIV